MRTMGSIFPPKVQSTSVLVPLMSPHVNLFDDVTGGTTTSTPRRRPPSGDCECDGTEGTSTTGL